MLRSQKLHPLAPDHLMVWMSKVSFVNLVLHRRTHGDDGRAFREGGLGMQPCGVSSTRRDADAAWTREIGGSMNKLHRLCSHVRRSSRTRKACNREDGERYQQSHRDHPEEAMGIWPLLQIQLPKW
jgi:hypothetical protein